MALDPEEVAHRVVAARELRGLKQTDLHEPMEQAGFGKHDLAKIERCDEKVRLTPGRRAAKNAELRIELEQLAGILRLRASGEN